MTTLETRRLILRPPEQDDLDVLARVFGDPHVMRFYPRTYDRVEVASWLQAWRDQWRDRGFGWFVAVLKDRGEAIGRIGLARLDGGPDIEIGWNLLAGHWGRELAPEGARAVLGFGFAQIGLRRILAVTVEENRPSQRVMEKLGMRFDGTGIYYGVRQRRYVLDRPGDGAP